MGDTVIDLHRMPFDGFRQPTSWDNIWTRTHHIKTAVGERMVLSPEDEVVFLAGNQLQALFAQWPKACLDLFVIFQKEKIDWDLLISKAKEAKVDTALWALCTALTSNSGAIPQEVLNPLRPKRRLQQTIELFFHEALNKGNQRKKYTQRIYWTLVLSQDISGFWNYLVKWLPSRMRDKMFS